MVNKYLEEIHTGGPEPTFHTLEEAEEAYEKLYMENGHLIESLIAFSTGMSELADVLKTAAEDIKGAFEKVQEKRRGLRDGLPNVHRRYRR